MNTETMVRIFLVLAFLHNNYHERQTSVRAEFPGGGGGGVLGRRTYGEVLLENVKSTLSRSQIPENDSLSGSKIFLNNTQTKLCPARKFVRNLFRNVEILPSKQFESHSQNANGLKRPFEIKNDKYGPCHGADFYKNDTLYRSRNPENDTLFSGTSSKREIYEYRPPPLGAEF